MVKEEKDGVNKTEEISKTEKFNMMNNLKANQENFKQTESKKQLNSNGGKTTIKIDKNTKILFDEGVYQFRTNRIDFIQKIVEEWMATNAPDTFELYKNKELYEQKKQNK